MTVTRAENETPEKSGLATPRSASDDALPHDGRVFVYQWFSGLFAREPSAESLAAWRSNEGAALLERLASHDSLKHIVQEIRRVASDGTASDARAIDLAAAFTRLFSGVAGRRTVPPYESFYADDSGRLFQEPAEKTAERLAALGTRISESFSEPADHVAVQLAIMAELVRRGGPRLENQADQRRFLDCRLLSWFPAFVTAAPNLTGQASTRPLPIVSSPSCRPMPANLPGGINDQDQPA